ncbi:MAG: hypothetical protein ABSG82_09010 [Sedimentisphaerales bacterium]|jgi:hypothetical protein
MLLFWRIRYLDTREKQFKDRDLWLDTDTLDNVTKSAVELTYELKDTSHQREMLRYRHFFQEKNFTKDELNLLHDGSVFIHEYYEDENGKELSNKQMAVILTGNPDAIMFSSGAKQHDIDYALTKKRPILIDQISLSQYQLKILGYFVRDLKEMLISAFYKEGPGTLRSSGGKAPNLYTAVNDEEIRSFVTIFRRLYMESEPANFPKAEAVFEEAVRGYPLGNWVKGVKSEYEAELDRKPYYPPLLGQGEFPFTRKRIIDVFLYTQYAHQPDATRIRQFQECLSSMNNNRPTLTWLFLTELHACSLHILNAGRIIANFYDRYLQYHKVSSDVLASVASVNPGIGILEKKEVRKARIFREKAEELAKTIWMNSGCPEGGHMQFINQASEQLKHAVTGKIDGQN